MAVLDPCRVKGNNIVVLAESTHGMYLGVRVRVRVRVMVGVRVRGLGLEGQG
jgi:hypothetical protein